ncbi:MAG: hypothetical protein WD059_13495 [Balneolaceae bacterium]
MHQVLSEIFPNAKIHIESDLLGAAKACFGDKAGIACILGTGSNAGIYDGEIITTQVPSLGFILGDEGSGSYFGKRVLQSYYYKTMPEDLRLVLEDKSDMQLESVLKKIYKEPQGNRFVASFAKLLVDYSSHSFIEEIMREGFADFADNQLAYFGDIKGREIGFTGSIAAIHSEILCEVLFEREMRLGVIVKNPIEKLADYHL